jgi:alkaline phosphatase
MMRMNRRFLMILCVAALALTTGLPSFAGNAPVKPAKYVILMIGDGMGSPQRVAAELYLRSRQGDKTAQLQMNTLPVKGMTTTQAADNPVTDSAAAATALACGEKTKNGVIGMDADCAKALETIAEVAKKQGKKVGIVSSVPIDHATPASFYAHNPKRSDYYEIAVSLPGSGFDYFAGVPFLGNDKAKKRPLPADLAQKAGYQIVRTEAEFKALKKGAGKTLVLTDVAYQINEKGGELNLKDLTEKGLEVLDNPNGFFLMVEGGKIDWSGHANDLATNVREVLAFDEAVASALQFYNEHKEETLLIVTADHETGGMRSQMTGEFDPALFCHFIEQQTMSGEEFGLGVKTWNAKRISFDQALKEMKDAFGLTDLTEQELQAIRQAYDAVVSGKTGKKVSPELARMYGNKNPVVLACQNIIAKRCGVVWTSFQHTAATVPTSAVGLNAENFGGQTDNTEIGQRLRAVLLADGE